MHRECALCPAPRLPLDDNFGKERPTLWKWQAHEENSVARNLKKSSAHNLPCNRPIPCETTTCLETHIERYYPDNAKCISCM